MIEFGTLTRSVGKIFVAIHANVPQDGRIIAKSYCFGRGSAPAIVVERDHSLGEYVLIIASLATEQVIKVRVLDRHGKIVERAEKVFGHMVSALTSKYNTFRKVDGLEEIRSFDELGIIDEAHIRVDRMAVFPDKSELVHAYVVASCPNETAAHSKMTIQVLDRRGEIVPLVKLSVMKDAYEPVAKGSSLHARFIEVSIHYERPLEYLFVWVRFEDDVLPAGFIGLEKEQTRRLRDTYFAHYNDCGFGPRYDEWFRKVHRTSAIALEAQRSAHFEYEPLFSIIVPLFKTPLDYLHDMAASVLAQTYGKFELVLVNASPDEFALVEAIEALAAADERVKIVSLEQNMDIALNTGVGIKAASGDYLAFLDHDDILEPDILYHYAIAINAYPETDLLYCDEDKYLNGRFVDGFLKPDFDWELLASINYVCHMLAVRASVVAQINLSESEVAGAQDWDMTYKVAERARNIFHVRKVLYHWRIHEQSAAKDYEAKPWTHEASAKVVKHHFDRVGIPVEVVDGVFANAHAVNYELPVPNPRVSIIIPTKDHTDLLDQCLSSIHEKTSYGNFEIVVVENNSTRDETFAYYELVKGRYDNCKIVCFEGGFNFSAICNYGVQHADGEYLLFLNNDTEIISPDWIERLLGPMQRPDVACTGAKLLFLDDTIQHAGVIIPKSPPGHVAVHFPRNDDFYYGFLQHAREVSAVTGACMMIKRSDFDAVGGFDEELAVAYNDVDLCLRLRQMGKRIVYEPRAELYHYESASRGADEIDSPTRVRFSKEKGIFMTRWSKYIGAGDPMYGVHFFVGAGYWELDWASDSWGI